MNEKKSKVKRLNLEFELFHLKFIPRFRYFGFWLLAFAFREGSAGWILFGIIINEISFKLREKVRLTITIFNYCLKIGRYKKNEQTIIR